MERKVAILGFHKLGREPWDAWDTWFYTPQSAFAEQLAYLRDDGWAVLDAATLFHGLAEPESLPERAAVITFDDAYRSVRDVALPLLVEFGYPAIVFVPSDFVGRNNDFEAGNAPEEPLCDWDALRELDRSGVSVQSHGASHRAFSALALDEQEAELRRSKEALEAEIGKPVEAIAYPYGDDGGAPDSLAGVLDRLGYRAAFLYGGGVVSLPTGDRYRLTRVAIGSDTDLATALTER